MEENKNVEEMCNCDCEHSDCECNHELEHECNCHTKNHDNAEEHECCHDKKSKKFKKDKNAEKLKQAYMQIEELEDQALRAKADLINYRKRKDEEVTRMLKYANEDLVKELLPAIDNLERAIKLDDDNLTDEVSKFLSGVKMIYCSTIASLEKYGVKAIDGANKPFDPTYHQAVMTEMREGVEPGMVLEVLQKGYLLKDKVIRHAMVKVSQ